MNTVFILKTDADSKEFKKAIDQFLTQYCKDTDKNVAIFELTETGKKQAIELIKN
ncbi:hypothetical protein [Calidifontibacillus erzurumensis]|uniref:hypothetical protein n=1 Tax=Calidifontibacillus erzurumensis TaxID=2741433 RepID=UPI0035B56C0E